jgi:hypothetical protein
MTELLSIIAYMIKPFDNDGLDLYFADSTAKQNGATSSKLVQFVAERTREDFGLTNMSFRLEQIQHEYTSKIRSDSEKGKSTRGLNVYIFTDARWLPSCDIVPAIDKMVGTLVANKLPEHHIGLQFVSFGNDVEGLKRLQLVDNYLVSRPHGLPL